MAQRKHVYVRSSSNSIEYWNAYNDRTNGLNVRLIHNPRGAAAVRVVLDQIPRVKAELDVMETHR
jgi:hypothetical protein